MKEIYSDAIDCLELARYLKRNLKSQIEFYGSCYTSVPSGMYFSKSEESGSSYLYENGLPFYYKYNKDWFLRIGVGSNAIHENSMGEELAALSKFYQVLEEKFGSPTVFYTTKDDLENNLSFQWSFVNEKDEVEKFRSGKYFDDAEIDKLIVIDKEENSNNITINDNLKEYISLVNNIPIQLLNNITLDSDIKSFISESIGLPFELIDLVSENIDDYKKYRNKLYKENWAPPQKKLVR